MNKEDVVYMYTMEYYSAIKKNGILPFVTTWLDLEGILLSEISQKEKDKYHMISLICQIQKQNKQNKQNKTHKIQRTDQWLPEGRGLGVGEKG